MIGNRRVGCRHIIAAPLPSVKTSKRHQCRVAQPPAEKFDLDISGLLFSLCLALFAAARVGHDFLQLSQFFRVGIGRAEHA